MLLLAVAIVFLGLGWHSAATKGDNPEQDLEAAQKQVTSTTTAAPASTSATAAAADKPELCVFNAGSITGLAGEVSKTLKEKGYTMASPGNLSTSSITENTVFYDDGQKTQAQAVATALGDDASVDPRPSAFTECPDGIPVIVVTR